MVLPIAVALMAGAVHNKVKKDALAAQRDKEDRAEVVRVRGRQRAADERADAMQSELDAAGRPLAPVVQSKPADVDNRDVGADWTPQITVMDRPVADMQAASDAIQTMPGQNSRGGMARRSAAVHRKYGNQEMAGRLEALGKAMDSEGVMSFVSTNLARIPDEVSISKGNDLFDLDGLDAYNAAGVERIPAGARGKAFLRTMANGQKVRDFALVDADGKPISNFPSGRQLEDLHGFTRVQLAERERLVQKDANDAGDKKSDNDRLDRQLAETGRHNREQLAASGKLDPQTKLRIDLVTEQIKSVTDAITKAESDPMTTPEARLMLNMRLEGLKKDFDSLLSQPGDAPMADRPTERRPSSMELVQADMARRGVKDAVIQLQGMPTMTVGRGAAAPDPMFPAASMGPAAGAPPRMLPVVGIGGQVVDSMRRASDAIGAALAPNWDAQAKSAIGSGDKTTMRALLKERFNDLSAGAREALAFALAE